MKTVEKRSSRIMNSNATRKEALNRQFVALANDFPIERGLFTCNQFQDVASDRPAFTIGSFEDEYPIYRDKLMITIDGRSVAEI